MSSSLLLLLLKQHFPTYFFIIVRLLFFCVCFIQPICQTSTTTTTLYICQTIGVHKGNETRGPVFVIKARGNNVHKPGVPKVQPRSVHT